MSGLRSNASFVRLFSGRIVSNAGDSMYFVAAMWLVWELTHSPLYTGVAGFLVRGLGSFNFLVGPLIDRWSLRRLLVVTQFVQAFAVMAVPVVAMTDQLSVWVVLLIMPVLTLLNESLYTAQNAALPRIVTDENLVRANSMFSFATRGVDMTFNAASGVLVAVIGAVSLYAVDAVTFVVAGLLFVGISIPDAADLDPNEDANGDADAEDEGYLAELREGIGYVRGSVFPALLLGGIVVNFAYGVTLAILPAFAETLGGSEAFGLLMGAEAGGILLGSLLASFVEEFSYGRLTIVGYAISAVCWFAAIAASSFALTVGLFFAAFVPIGTSNVVLNSMIQSAVDESLLARVTSLFFSVSSGMMPVGMLLGGAAGGVVGSRTVMYTMAVALGVFSLYYLAHPQLRSLPSVVEADDSTLGLGTAVDPADAVGGD